MPLGSVTRTRDLELGAQVRVLMKEHQTLLGFTTKTESLKLEHNHLIVSHPSRRDLPLSRMMKPEVGNFFAGPSKTIVLQFVESIN
jgi:hypothetical protein